MSGLDAGEYTVVETQAPDGYNTVPSFTFQIYPVYKETTGDIDTIRVQTSNANVSTINVYDGVVDLVVKDKAGMTCRSPAKTVSRCCGLSAALW